MERVLAIVGGIDLLHANDSKDPAGSGRDRHQNLGAGEIGADALRADDPRRRARRSSARRPAGADGDGEGHGVRARRRSEE